ncbi:zinc finger protein 669-like [Anopheles marshallii]|uniref:zinc finger protein 669-like n=1 Tax=Anopheles marshallii TaxID=1521116 RepID=UPI00237AFDF8|nr:zinc finger protein 669-like [Anopheles marshallii]
MSACQETLLSEGTGCEPNSEWNNMCRTCLQSGVSRSIFELDESLQLSYADKVMQCVNVTIRAQDDLPNRICSQCIEDLNVAYRFQLNCLEASALLHGSDTFDCLEEKQPDLSPIVMPIESAPEDEDQIAIHLDSGIMYTYKPPAGLNVKLTRSFIGSEETTARNGSDTIIDETDAGTQEEAEKFDTKTKMMINTLPNSKQESKNDEVEYLIYRKDDLDIVATTAGNTELKVEESVFGKQTKPMVNRSAFNEKRHHSMGEEGVKTLQTIRKTNRPNEMKPTIEMVTSQPATDGTGVETVIRIKRNLAGPKPSFLCKICNVTYKHKHALDTHMRRHRGDRPHKCGYCEKSFVVAFELQRHVRIHTGQKPYKCQYCDRAYSDFGSKTKHERTHTGERPYVCEFCDKAFSYSHVLSSHRLIHTGVKKYCCPICGKRFAKSHHLKSHCNTHSSQTLIATGQAKDDTDGLQAENNSIKQDTTHVVYSELLQDELIASNDDQVTVRESSTLLGQQQPDGVVLVDSYPDTGSGLLTVEWPMVVDGEKGTTASGVTIASEELESVSIVNFSDYMIKTEGLDGFMVEDDPVDEEPLVGRQLMGR